MTNSLSIVLSGEAGQGLATIEGFLMKALSTTYYVFSTSDVMSRVRGGSNSVEIRISETNAQAYRETVDLMFLLNDHALDRLKRRITPSTRIFGESGSVDEAWLQDSGAKYNTIELAQWAKDSGLSKLSANTILFGFIMGMLKMDPDTSLELLRAKFETRGEKIYNDSVKSFETGYQKGQEHILEKPLVKRTDNKPFKIVTGTESIGIGALAGGCNFIAAYPMSPGTGVLTYLAGKSREFDVFVEQAEDEIAAINMTIGAWYAGARAMTTTSGGGFALMEEGISLSGITETPCVVHIGQRPGPGTGLPTRTEQADLNLAIYSGHGEFPKIVLAPGKLEDGALLTQKAFYLADKYQVPVIILSDAFFLESFGQMEGIDFDPKYLEQFITETDADYLRYKLTADGISPRGIPGYGKGMVKADSDEHEEDGTITEDFDVRIAMNTKRLNKSVLLLKDYIEPEWIGSKEAKNLVIGWGSTYGVLKEFVETTGRADVAFLNVKQVYPLHESLLKHLEEADNVICVENNATGQFARLLRTEFGFTVDHKILKSNGEPYAIEEISRKLEEVLI